jgi:hypothetical protein
MENYYDVRTANRRFDKLVLDKTSMAPGLRIVKRQAEEIEEEEEEVTTIATKIFGKHLHKVKVTTSTLEPETEGSFAVI